MSDPPNHVTIRTYDGGEFRYRAFERASEFYDCNRSDAVAYASNDVLKLVEAAVDVLEDESLTGEQRERFADVFDDAVRAISFDLEAATAEVDVDR